jgi:BirA family biotin operon repressor/biotin-[acetyl-CoA-carboxylase] ligase
MVGAMAVAVPLRERYELDAGVKWPNDVMIGSRKICGVLAESAVRGGAMDFAVIGIGINVLHGEDDFPEGVRGRATSVRLETRGPATRPGVLKDVATALEQRYRAFQREGFAGIRPELLGISPMIGGSVRVETGLERLEGTAIDIDQEGALVLMTAGGERRLWAGEVTGCAQLEPRRER